MSTKTTLPTMSRLGVVFLTWRRHLESSVRPYGVTLKQKYLLEQLRQKEHLYPADIAEMLFCDRPTVTVILNNLKRYGWITSQKDDANGRRQKVMLTPAGEEVSAKLADLPRDPVDPLSCFSETEKLEFDRLLRKLHRHLKTNGL